MSDTQILPAEKQDAKTISELFKVLDTENYNFSKLEDIQKAIVAGDCYKAILGGNIIGAMVLKIEDQSHRLDLLVSQSKGGGTALINHAVEISREKGIPKLWCWSLIRYNAKGFYEKMGFGEVFLLKNQWYGEDCYLFGKIII